MKNYFLGLQLIGMISILSKVIANFRTNSLHHNLVPQRPQILLEMFSRLNYLLSPFEITNAIFKEKTSNTNSALYSSATTTGGGVILFQYK